MNRCLALILAAAPLAAAWLAPSSQAEEKLNVLFIAVDDLRPELGCYGNTRVKSPNLDRLAREGMVFRRAYCQQAVCSPSRTSLLTGLRPDSTRVYDLETHFRDTVGKDLITLPQQFKSHGWHAAGMGKIYHGGLDDADSWSEPHRSPRKAAYALAENLELVQRKRAEARQAGRTAQQANRAARGPATEKADVPDNHFHDGAVAEMAIETMQRLKEEPFFLAVGFIRPHLPFVAPAKYWDLYDRSEIKLSDNPEPPQGAPPFALTTWGELRQYEGMPRQGPLSDEAARELIHGYLAAVSYMDAQVGRLLDALDELGLANRTIVVLWGDHGWKLGDHGAWCKHTNYELDARVPLILKHPKAKTAGQGTDALVEFVDIYPTLCELAGVPLPKHLEGTSLAPLLAEPKTPWKSAAFSQYPRTHQRQALMGYAMRTNHYRYVEWQDRKSGEIVAQELYDHRTDPHENMNLAVDERHAPVVADLSRRLKAGWRAARP